eukprot:s12709_g1.t1
MSGNKDVIDRVLLEERHKQAGTLALSFPWEQGIFKEILGSTAGLPTLPVVEVPLNLPSSSSATLDDFVQVARAAATTEASIANHYRLAVERATWRARSKLSVGEQVTLVCQKPPRKQARPFLASEVLKLEAFLSEYSNSAIDRFGVGCLLFAIFSIARLGDLKAIDGFELDYEEGHEAYGYIETTSFSHKSRMSSNSQGYQMKLIAPVRGIGPGTWGVDFVNAATEVGRPLVKICRGEPLLPALDVNGDFQLRAMKSSNLVRWVHSVLKGDVFTGHSAKATLLSWLAKWG